MKPKINECEKEFNHHLINLLAVKDILSMRNNNNNNNDNCNMDYGLVTLMDVALQAIQEQFEIVCTIARTENKNKITETEKAIS